MTEYIVIKDILNIRDRPSDDPEESFAGELYRNEIVYLHDEPVKGKIPAGGSTNLWLKDQYGQLVHSEGVRQPSWQEKKQELFSVIRRFWQKGTGRGVTIALLDTGVVDSHHLLPPMKHFDVYNDRIHPKVKSMPTDFHGSRMAGIFCGLDNRDILGLCPDVTVVDYRIIQKSGMELDRHLTTALKSISKNPEIKIINMSFEFIPETIADSRMHELDSLMEECTRNGKIIMAASGNHCCLYKKKQVTYPGKSKYPITVGVIRNGDAVNFIDCIHEVKATERPPDCFIELEDWTVCTKQDLSVNQSTNSSEATAIMSSLVALKLSNQPDLTSEIIRRQINQSCVIYKNHQGLVVRKLNINAFLNL